MVKQYETVFIVTPVLSEEQMKETVKKYTDLLTNAGLVTPFDEACLKTVCETAVRWLESFDMTGIE